jgi:leucine dehydrogenase
MDTFKVAEELGLEEVVFCHDRQTGLKAIIAIHDTTLGPALGGTRMKAYATEEDALWDACRLARAMSYKAALADLDLGGGKAVIIGDPAQKTEALLRAYGRFVDRLGGRYITSVDSGFSSEDLEVVRRETPYAHGGLARGGRGGDPSPDTAYGVFKGMEACLEALGEEPSLRGKKVAVQGLGNVGIALVSLLTEAGASVVAADIQEDKVGACVSQLGAEPCSCAQIHRVECDIYSPCALGGAVNPLNIQELNCRIIAGAANNVLADARLGLELHEKGILYAPDYVINAGGLIHVALEKTPCQPQEIRQMVSGIKGRLLQIFRRSALEGLPPVTVSNRMAEERLEAGRKWGSLRTDFSRSFYLQKG